MIPGILAQRGTTEVILPENAKGYIKPVLLGSSPYKSLAFDTETLGDIASSGISYTYEAAVHSANYGFFAGGWDSTDGVRSAIQGLKFADESHTSVVATLVQAREKLVAVHSSLRGYFAGGNASGVSSTEIDGLIFSTVTAINPSAVMPRLTESFARACSTAVGYIVGNASALAGRYVQKLQYGTETLDEVAAALPNTLVSHAGVTTGSKGYFVFGSLGVSIHEFDFATETWADTSVDATTAPASSTGINSFENGYFFAGASGSGAEVAGFNFATETAYTAVADVTVQGSSGVQSGGIL